MLPPGRARLVTSPTSTGSDDPARRPQLPNRHSEVEGWYKGCLCVTLSVSLRLHFLGQ
jgi:hypothetical protein